MKVKFSLFNLLCFTCVCVSRLHAVQSNFSSIRFELICVDIVLSPKALTMQSISFIERERAKKIAMKKIQSK